jgi:hypothetical protein
VSLSLAIELVHLPGAEPVVHEDLQVVHVLPANQSVLEDLLASPIRAAHELDETLPLLLLDRQREDLAVDAVGDEPGPQGTRTEP